MSACSYRQIYRDGLLAVCLAAIICNSGGCGQATTEAPDTTTDVEPSSAGTDVPDQPQHTNRLIDETSPYLQQHAHNPVDWYPWGEEAFEKAKQENKPIFLSVGYSTCYWCHVMERECFEQEDVAAILNEHFIAIKVDREERPDVDEQYMLATQLISGEAGWPNSVWLTPDGRPWMAGTYYPREQFKQLLTQLNELWTTQRDQVDQEAVRIAESIRRSRDISATEESRPLFPLALQEAMSEISQSFDSRYGGFGDPPKSPPHGQLRLLVQEFDRTGDERLRSILQQTLQAMQLGGIRDHLGGGFHRYSTDREWLLPHFEKMLYDNAQLMRAYTDGFRITGDDEHRAVVDGIFEWLIRDMTDSGGGFYSAIDSESEQKEGHFYVWTQQEVLDQLGPADGELFSAVYGFTSEGNFREESTGQPSGANIPYLPVPVAQVAEALGIDGGSLESQLAGLRSRLLKVRQQRPFPHFDDKILTSWNALMIDALAYAGRVLEEPRYAQAAERAADFLLEKQVDDGRVYRSWRGDRGEQPGFLDDYAFFAMALLELHETTGESRWLDEARRLTDTMLAEFQDAERGGFYFTANDEKKSVLGRSRQLLGGGNIPSANGVAAQVLIRLHQREPSSSYGDVAVRALHALAPVMWRSPSGADSLTLAVAQAANAGLDTDVEAVDDSSVGLTELEFRDPPVRGRATSEPSSVLPGDAFVVRVELEIDDGWHLYGPNPNAEFLIESTVEALPSDVFTVTDVERPEGVRKQDETIGQEMILYEHEAVWTLTVQAAADAVAGQATAEFQVTVQACDQKRCLKPQKYQLRLPVEIRSVAE